MSKKSKKRRVSGSKSTKIRRSHAAGTTNAPSDQTGVMASSSRLKSGSEFNPDYTYVIKDLKRIGIMAGSFFIILIALSFYLR
jgi:hypothetical protein